MMENLNVEQNIFEKMAYYYVPAPLVGGGRARVPSECERVRVTQKTEY